MPVVQRTESERIAALVRLNISPGIVAMAAGGEDVPAKLKSHLFLGPDFASLPWADEQGIQHMRDPLPLFATDYTIYFVDAGAHERRFYEFAWEDDPSVKELVARSDQGLMATIFAWLTWAGTLDFVRDLAQLRALAAFLGYEHLQEQSSFVGVPSDDPRYVTWRLSLR